MSCCIHKLKFARMPATMYRSPTTLTCRGHHSRQWSPSYLILPLYSLYMILDLRSPFLFHATMALQIPVPIPSLSTTVHRTWAGGVLEKHNLKSDTAVTDFLCSISTRSGSHFFFF